MDNNTFDSLCDELNALIASGPGANPSALSKAKAVLFKIQHDSSANSYLKEKITETTGDFEVWFSARRWNKQGDSGSRIRSFLYADIMKLRRAWTRVHPA